MPMHDRSSTVTVTFPFQARIILPRWMNEDSTTNNLDESNYPTVMDGLLTDEWGVYRHTPAAVVCALWRRW